MQNLQNNQVLYSAVAEPLVKTPVPTIVLPEMSSEALAKYNKAMESLQQEQQHNIEKSSEAPIFSPGGALFWILLGAFLYFIISKINENKNHFDCCHDMCMLYISKCIRQEILCFTFRNR